MEKRVEVENSKIMVANISVPSKLKCVWRSIVTIKGIWMEVLEINNNVIHLSVLITGFLIICPDIPTFGE